MRVTAEEGMAVSRDVCLEALGREVALHHGSINMAFNKT